MQMAAHMAPTRGVTLERLDHVERPPVQAHSRFSAITQQRDDLSKLYLKALEKLSDREVRSNVAAQISYLELGWVKQDHYI